MELGRGWWDGDLEKYSPTAADPSVPPLFLPFPEVGLELHGATKDREGIVDDADVESSTKSIHYGFLNVFTDGSEEAESGGAPRSAFVVAETHFEMSQ